MNLKNGLLAAGLAGLLASCSYDKKDYLPKIKQPLAVKETPKLYEVFDGDLKPFEKEERNFQDYLKQVEGNKVIDTEAYFTSGVLKPGTYAPNILNMSGLEDKTILIDFWSTDCGPCMAIMPKLKELYTKCKDHNFEIVSIVSKSKEEDVEEFLKKCPLPYRVIFDKENILYKNADIRAVPSFVYLNKGKVEEFKVGGGERREEWLKDIEKRILKK